MLRVASRESGLRGRESGVERFARCVRDRHRRHGGAWPPAGRTFRLSLTSVIHLHRFATAIGFAPHLAMTTILAHSRLDCQSLSGAVITTRLVARCETALGPATHVARDVASRLMAHGKQVAAVSATGTGKALAMPLAPVPKVLQRAPVATNREESQTVLAPLPPPPSRQPRPSTPPPREWPSTRPPDRLPAAEVDRLTNHVLRELDHRITAFRERRGRN